MSGLLRGEIASLSEKRTFCHIVQQYGQYSSAFRDRKFQIKLDLCKLLRLNKHQLLYVYNHHHQIGMGLFEGSKVRSRIVLNRLEPPVSVVSKS